MNIDNKSVLILGFGREGRSTLEFLKRYANPKSITVADRNESIDTSGYEGVSFVLGENYDSCLEKYDVVIKSPGVKLKREVTSQTAMFLELFSDKTIGITGTKGKSTTSALIHHILKQEDDSALLLGNMGIPAFSMYEQAKEAQNIVYEMSSHQLLDITTAPHIAVLLNFYQEHLDYYGSYNEYIEAKCNIFKKQKDSDFIVYNADDEEVVRRLNDCRSIKYAFSTSEHGGNGCYLNGNEIVFCNEGVREIVIRDISNVSLKGKHNLMNVMAATIVCKLRGICNESIERAVATFETLPHRLERVGEFDGIEFYNDSIATIPQAAIQAIEALKRVDTLILGGYDRGIDYDDLIAYLAKHLTVRNVILTGEAGRRMMCLFSKYEPENKNIIWLESYDEIVRFAKLVTRKGEICLLSPAAASYDAFKNFEERGTRFKELVANIEAAAQ